MSQESKNTNEEIFVELKLKVSEISFSNHKGFSENQIEKAIEEFKEDIKEELEHKVIGSSYQQDILESVDYVSYKVTPNN